LNDDPAIKLIAAGDTNALASLYKEYRNDVYRLAYVLTKQRADAEDITQEVFLTAVEKAHSYRVNISEKAWLLRITRNKALNCIKSRSRFLPLSETIEDHKAVEAEQDIEFLDVLNCLTFKNKQIVLFHIAYGLSHKEVSIILKMSHGAVRKQYSRALKTLEASIDIGRAGKGETNHGCV